MTRGHGRLACTGGWPGSKPGILSLGGRRWQRGGGEEGGLWAMESRAHVYITLKSKDSNQAL